MKQTTQARPLSEIAQEIWKDWAALRTNRNNPARPYLEAMLSLNDISDMYINDSAKSIVCYFLSNASTWRGETAKRVKLELNKMVK